MKTRRQMLAIAIVIALASAAVAAGGAAEEKGGDQTLVVKELSIMSKVLDKRLGDALGQDVYTASLVQRGVEAFHVPGVGAIFFVDVKFPVAEPPRAEPVEDEDEDPNDLWKQFERDFEGGSLQGSRSPFRGNAGWMYGGGAGRYGYSTGSRGASRSQVSRAKLENLKNTVFEVFARYGRKITSLKDGDQIVVVVNGAGGGLKTFFQKGPVEFGAGGGGPAAGVATTEAVETASEPAVAVTVGKAGKRAEVRFDTSAGAEAGVVVAEVGDGGEKVVVTTTGGGAAEAPGKSSGAVEAIAVEAPAGAAGGEAVAESGSSRVSKRVVVRGADAGPAKAQVVHRTSGSKLSRFTVRTRKRTGPGYRSVLVIRIPVSDLVDDAAKLAEKADVTAYSY